MSNSKVYVDEGQVQRTTTLLIVTETTSVRLPPTELVARRAIRALAEARDFLSYQLSAAHGAITEEQLDEVAEKYLRVEAWNPAQLATSVSTLACLVPELVDAEFVATVFKCDPAAASRAVLASASETAQANAQSLPGASET